MKPLLIIFTASLAASLAFGQPPTTIVPGTPITSATMNANFLGLYNGRAGRWSGAGAPGSFPFSIIGDIYTNTAASPPTFYACARATACNAVGSGNWQLLDATSGTVTTISGSGPSWLTWTITNPTTAPVISLAPTAAQASHQVIGTCGTATTFSPCALLPGDLPITTVFNNQANTYSAGLQHFGAAQMLMPVGTANPATCTVGQVFFRSDSTAGQNWWFCTATNTWTQQLSGGGAVSVFTGSTATAPAFSATPTFSLADISVKSPMRFEPGALTANVTAVTFTNPTAGAKFSIAWTQDATGGRTVIYGASVAGTAACTVDPTANATTTQFFEVGSNGTTVNGTGCKTTSSTYSSPEQAAPGTPPASTFTCWGDSTDHSGFECMANNAASKFKMVLSGVDVNTVTGQVIATHLSAALPRAQGGTNNTAGTTPQQFFGTAAPGSVAGNLPGDLYSDTTNHNDYWCNATSGTAAPACTSVATGAWTLLNGGGGGASISFGAYASVPTCTTSQFIYAANNASLTAFCNGASSLIWKYKGATVTPTQNTDFATAYNMTGATTTNYAGTWDLAGGVSSVGDLWHGRVQAVPATPYTVEVCWETYIYGGQYNGTGLGWTDGTKISLWDLQQQSVSGASAGVIQYFTNSTTFSSTLAQAADNNSPRCYAVSDSGTNRHYLVSDDQGSTWRQVYSEASGTNLVPTGVGVFVNDHTATTPSTIHVISRVVLASAL